MITVTAAGPSCSRVICGLKWRGQGEAAKRGESLVLGAFVVGIVSITTDKEALFPVLLSQTLEEMCVLCHQETCWILIMFNKGR